MIRYNNIDSSPRFVIRALLCDGRVIRKRKCPLKKHLVKR